MIIENGDGAPHVLLEEKSARVGTVGERPIIKFVAKKGAFQDFCPSPGR